MLLWLCLRLILQVFLILLAMLILKLWSHFGPLSCIFWGGCYARYTHVLFSRLMITCPLLKALAWVLSVGICSRRFLSDLYPCSPGEESWIALDGGRSTLILTELAEQGFHSDHSSFNNAVSSLHESVSLNDVAQLEVADSGSSDWAMTTGSLAATDASVAASNTMVLTAASDSIAGPSTARPRGRPRKNDIARPRKTEAPTTDEFSRRSTHSNKDGFKFESLPYSPTPRKTSKVAKATPPDVLQLTEMQRIGVEECCIDPAELTAEQLMKERDE